MKNILLITLGALLISLPAFAQYGRRQYVLGKGSDGALHCFRANAAGRPYGNALKGKYCLAFYRLDLGSDGHTHCFMADKNGVTYGRAVAPRYCQGRG